MKKLYGSLLCEDCVEAIEFLDKKQIKYKFIDICSSMSNLKEFLYFRDHRNEYEEIKKEGYIGIPLIVDTDNKIYLLEDIYNIKEEN